MRRIFLLAVCLYLLSCHDRRSAGQSKDTLDRIDPKDTAASRAGVSGLQEGVPIKAVNAMIAHLELRDYSISYIARFLFPLRSLARDSSFYFKGNYVAVTRKATAITDTIETDSYDDHAPCVDCSLTDLTDSLQIRPFLVRLSTAGEDGDRNIFIAYRGGHLKEFEVDDMADHEAVLHRGGDSILYTSVWGVDEVVTYLEYDFPLIIDVKTFAERRPLPEKQFIGFKTVATEGFKAYRVIDGQLSASLVPVQVGDSVLVDTLYRGRQKVGLLIGDSTRVEIKLETARQKLRHNPPPG